MINFITVLRVFLLLPLAAVMLTGEKTWTAVAIFAIAGITDWADGWLARRLKQTSTFGAMLDQICDKIFIVGTLVLMTAAGMLEKLMLVPVLGIIAREFFVAGWREYAAQTARAIPVDKFGKVKTTLQFSAILLMLVPVAGMPCVWINHVGAGALWVAAGLGVISAARYFSAIKSPE